MDSLAEIVHPHHCFCDFPDEKLKPWVIKKFVDHIPTVDLLNSTDDPEEREIISIVALLDIEDDILLILMDQAGVTREHLIDCREHAKQMLGV